MAHTRERYCLSVLEVRNPRSRCEQGWFLPRTGREDLLQAFPFASQMAISLCCCMQTSLCILSVSPFYQDTSHTGFGAHRTPVDLILANCICNDPIAK